MSRIAPAFTPRSALLLLVAAAPVVVVAMLGAFFTARGLVSWYPALNKPFPLVPDTVFPLVWTFLYALMMLASWRILRARDEGKTKALALYALQLGLGLLWSYVFFARQAPWGGVMVILPLFVAILLTFRAFRTIDVAAANALLPNLAWVGFATWLNLGIALLN